MSAVIERVVHDALKGSTDITAMIGRTELQLEVWFNYFLERVGERNLFNRVQIFDDLTFNTDGYQPTILPVVNQLVEGMTSIGMDLIKPSPIAFDAEDSELMKETFGELVASEFEDLYWVLFTIIEPKHPLKGVRYATAYRKGELIYPPTDPEFTASYPDEKVHEQARGVFIDVQERFLKAVRPELFKTDVHGKILQ